MNDVARGGPIDPSKLLSKMMGLLLALVLIPMSAQAARSRSAGDDKVVDVPVGGSQAVKVPSGIERIVVGDPQICDVVSLPAGNLLLTAKSAGETQITIWSREAGATVYHVYANLPVSSLQAALKEAFAQEDDLTVHAVGGAAYLTGTVNDASVIEAAGRMAQSMLGNNGKRQVDIINLVQVTTSQQVQVQLRFVEVSRTSLRQLGFNAWVSGASNSGALFGPNVPQNYTDPSQNFVGPTPKSPNATALPILLSPVSGAFALSFASGQFGPLSATLSLLEGHGVAKTISEPTLVANSGEKAEFIVGGEYPIPVPDPLGRVIIQFKKYGAQLNFVPTVVAADTVHLKLDAIVSAIDKQNTTTVGSSQVPGITTRESATSVRMRDGQSFAIAGLLSDQITAQDNKIPFLGDIPLVGAFFRNTNYSRSQEELVVLVSVRLVKPMEPGETPPLVLTDEFNDPGDLALFLLGSIDKTKITRPPLAPGQGTRPRGAVRNQASPGGAVGFSR